ncbi:MAG: minor capsid protein, partial [Thermoguttaceae bacterium]|nr:minor capsid protein [Thermoguttaceae bacterium]
MAPTAAGERSTDGSTEGASSADWFKRWKTNDLNRIAQAVQRGAIEELSVDEVAANVWNACNVSRNSARTVARTIINGVSNAARAETLFANDDAIDGIEFLATLDARTSHICGALDGTVWRGDEMKRARRPPLHPNCRSTLIPVVDLVDPETGEKIEETAERPAQNADGTYSQVAAKTTFKDYFESQPETFQREWLGEKRFELWKSGQLKFEDLAKPATTYRATPADLTPSTEKPKETAASDDKPNNAPALLADAIRKVGGEDAAAEILRRYAADAKAKADEKFDLAASSEGFAQRFKRLASFSSSSKAATEAREKLKIDADYSKIPRDVAEEMNKELEKALEKFGSFGFVKKIEPLDRTNALGSYDGKKGIIYLRPDLNLDGLFGDMEISFKEDANAYSTASRRHPLRHEIGHAIMQAV